MKLALIAALALSANAAEIKYSRQDRAVLLAYADGAPLSVALYGAHVCGSGPGEETFDPDMVLFMAADWAAVQDSDSAIFAAQEGRKRSLRYKAVNVTINGIEYAGFLVVGLATGNVLVIPKLATGLVAVVATLVPKLLKRREELAHQPLPAGWITPDMRERVLAPTKCDHFTFLMSAEAPTKFKAETSPVVITRSVPEAKPVPAVQPSVAPAMERRPRNIPDRDSMTAAEYIVAVLHPDVGD